MEGFLNSVIDYLTEIDLWEFSGLIFGLIAVVLLVKENIWTWPAGIVCVIVSFVVFGKAKLYADLALNAFYMVLYVYGWWYWIHGKKKNEEVLAVTHSSASTLILLTSLSLVGVFLSGYLLETYTDAALPYWDSATTILSLTGMWLTAKKKIDSWYFWFVVDVLATGVYFYKEIYFYALLYFIYIGLAVAGYLAWRKTMTLQKIA